MGSKASATNLQQRVRRHLRRMQASAVLFLLTVPAAGIGAFFLPRARLRFASQPVVLAATLVVALAYAFSVNHTARVRLGRIRDAFDEHGNVNRLLDDHFRTYLAVLLRLEMINLCGLINAEAGSGPRTTVWYVVVAGLLMLLAWPTEHKTRLLLRRVGTSSTSPSADDYDLK